MRQTSVIDIILLIFFSGGAETVLECVKVSNFTDKGAGCGDAETYPEVPDGSDEDCDDLGSLWVSRGSLSDLNRARTGLAYLVAKERRKGNDEKYDCESVS